MVRIRTWWLAAIVAPTALGAQEPTTEPGPWGVRLRAAISGALDSTHPPSAWAPPCRRGAERRISGRVAL
jgi:hypothetical protein